MGGSANRRIFGAWVGTQGSGKTYQLARRIEWARANPRIAVVYILDRGREMTSEADVIAATPGRYHGIVSELGNKLPRVVACQCGLDPENYEWVYREAIEQGDCLLVLDEAYAFLPPSRPISGDLQRIVFAGRHLTNLAGEDRPCHLLLATQYPRSVHPQVWSQTTETWASHLRGDRALSWVRDYHGRRAAEVVEKLEARTWVRIDKIE